MEDGPDGLEIFGGCFSNFHLTLQRVGPYNPASSLSNGILPTSKTDRVVTVISNFCLTHAS